MILGLCGGSGSGKSTVASFFASRGFLVLDADRIYHELVDAPSGCVSAIREAFGEEVLRPDGSLDRARLADLVFSGDGAEQRRRRLNEITHAFVCHEIRSRIGESGFRGVRSFLIDAPLLFEAGLDRDCDVVIAVTAPDEVRIERLMSRDGITREMAERRIGAQISSDALSQLADFTVVNGESLAALHEQLEALLLCIQQDYFMK